MGTVGVGGGGVRTLFGAAYDVAAVVAEGRLGVPLLVAQPPLVLHRLAVVVHGAQAEAVVVGGHEQGRAGVEALGG